MSELGIYYVIRHIQSQELMPQGKKNRGYSHWNPGVVDNHKFTEALPIPRLLDTRKKAHNCIIQWAALPNAHMGWRQTSADSEEQDIKITPDGRKKEDLEVVEVELTVRSHQK